MRHFMLYAACWTCLAGAVSAANPPKPADPANLQDAGITSRTVAALKHKLEGADEAARSELEEIADAAPQAGLAHWSLGLVRVGEDWIPFDRVVHETNRWPELYKYQQERAKRTDSFTDQLFLADGCREHKLFDEERAHLVGALEQDGTFDEAHIRLGDVKIDGLWVSRQQVIQFLQKQQLDEVRRAAWKDDVVRLHQAFVRAQGPGSLKLAQEQLEAIRTPDAIPAMERDFAAQGPREAAIYLDWVARIPSWEASLALAKQAVFAESPDLRAQAQLLLRDRPLEDYVPWLLSGLGTVKETSCDWSFDFNGYCSLRMNRTIVLDTEHAQVTVEQQQRMIPAFDAPTRVVSNGDGTADIAVGVPIVVPGTDLGGPSGSQAGNLAALMSHLDVTQQERFWFAASQDVRVDRIKRALTIATEHDELTTPDEWWSWWRGQNDFTLALGKVKSRQQYDQTWYVDRRRAVPTRTLQVTYIEARRHSCFAPGTLVETEQGPKAIQEVRRGDRVLAQDAETGELAFKPVLATTVRQQATLVKLHTAGDDIICSLGHPYWVAGQGWRMAKELQPGARLNTVAGTTTIETIEPAGTGTVYNLVVADAHTYFAGKNRIYTHDVTPRQPTDMVLPGLRKEFP